MKLKEEEYKNMECYRTLKMKRKDFEDVYDEFNDFSLSSPARKIRRLDADLPPIIEEIEDEPEIPMAFEQAGTDYSFGNNAGVLRRNGPLIEEIQSVPENEERAIVLFKPTITPLVQSPSNYSVQVNPQFINGLQNQILWGSQMNVPRRANDDETTQDNSSNKCLAVVPWVPSQLPSTQDAEFLGQIGVSDMMEAEDMEGVTMDVEDNSVVNAEHRAAMDAGVYNVNGGWHQWQQQHCMIPQPHHNTSNPIVWYR